MAELTPVEKEMKRKADMAKKVQSGNIGLGSITDSAFNPVAATVGGDPVSGGAVGQGVTNVMPIGSYVNPQTGQFSQTQPAPAPVATGGGGYTIYMIVAGVLVALYFYQKSHGRGMFDLSGLAKDFTGGSKRRRSAGEDEEE